MKLNKKVVLVALVLTFVLALSLMTACAPKVTLVGVELEQTTYVVGQELKGSLKVDVKGEQQLWDFSHEGVTVSGYQKNQLGEQTVTVSYEEQSVTANVKVVPRVVANDIKTDYVVGDSFDNTQGTLTFTRDNGTSFSVFFTDSNLTLEGFSTTVEALPCTVNATYVDGGNTYTGAFDVNVYGIESVSLTRPVNRNYASHANGLDLNGCFLTVTTALGTNYVQVTEDMCSGFDLSVVSQANPTATQVITVTYAGKTKAFEIEITYSNVSFIRDSVADVLSKIDWTGEETPTLTPEQGELAKLTAEKYFDLTDDQKALISPEESLVVMRNAARYVFGLYLDQWDVYKQAFNLESYAVVKEAYTNLLQESAPLRVYGRLLEQISSEFGGQEFFNGVNIKTYLSNMVTEDQFANNLTIFSYMITLYEGLASVPSTWTPETLVSTYAQQIDDVTLKINSSKFRGNNYRTLYITLSQWRENDDYFEVLYRYYYATENATVLLSLTDVCFPGEMEDLYGWMLKAYYEGVEMQGQQQIDSSLFMLYYSKAYDIAKAISSGNDDMYKFLYQNSKLTGFFFTAEGKDVPVSFAGLLYQLTVTDILNFGWYKHQGLMLGNDQFNEMWDKYLVILNGSLSKEYVQSAQFPVDLKDMFVTFATLAPNTQYEFLRSINIFYEQNMPEFVLDTSEYCYSYFTFFMVEYYADVTSEAEMAVFEKLLVAMESYALFNHRSDMTAKFVSTMQAVVDGFGALTEDQKTNFTNNFGVAYSRYEQLLKIVTKQAEHSDDFGEYEIYLNEAIIALQNLASLDTQMNNGTLDPSRAVVRYLSAYEYAEYLVNFVIEYAPQSVVYNYYHTPVISIGDTKATIEFMMYYFRTRYASLLLNVQIDSNSTKLAQVYFDLDLQEFLIKAYPILWYNEDAIITDAYASAIVDAMKTFREMPNYDKWLFVMLDANNDYYGNITKFGAKVLNEACVPVAQKLLLLEQTYLGYVTKTTETTLQQVVDLANEVKSLKEALEGNNVTNFEHLLLDMYNYYMTEVEKLQQAN